MKKTNFFIRSALVIVTMSPAWAADMVTITSSRGFSLAHPADTEIYRSIESDPYDLPRFRQKKEIISESSDAQGDDFNGVKIRLTAGDRESPPIMIVFSVHLSARQDKASWETVLKEGATIGGIPIKGLSCKEIKPSSVVGYDCRYDFAFGPMEGKNRIIALFDGTQRYNFMLGGIGRINPEHERIMDQVVASLKPSR